jgi:hypothetical protein
LFRIDAKRRNLKRNENETKRKRIKKEGKLPSFLLQSEMKRNGSEIFFLFVAKKVYENNMKRKNEKKENFKAKKDKVKFWDNLKETKKNIKVCLSVFQVYT